MTSYPLCIFLEHGTDGRQLWLSM